MSGAKKVHTASEKAAIPMMLLFGTCTVVTGKMLFEMKALGKKFEKPWWQVVTMFLGMAGCLLVYFPLRWWEKRKARLAGETAKLIPDSEAAKAAPAEMSTGKQWIGYFKIIPPAMCDLVATGLMNVGLLFIPASVWQLLRGSMVIFSAILSIIFLKKKLYGYNWLGIFIVLLALVMVGFSCIKAGAQNDSEESNSDNTLVGIFMVVGAQLIQASQIVIEEFLLSNVKFAPSLIVGMEGLWGTLVTCIIVLPLLSLFPQPYGEDTIEVFRMMNDNPAIFGVTLFYILVILFYNLAGMFVTMHFSAVYRTIMEAMRTLFIWMVDLFIYYAITTEFGERWSVWSWLELAGFCTLVFGNFVYKRIFQVPGLFYPEVQ